MSRSLSSWPPCGGRLHRLVTKLALSLGAVLMLTAVSAGASPARVAPSATAGVTTGLLPVSAFVDQFNIETDASGGMHLLEQGMDLGGGVHYAYCPSGCADKGNWTSLEIGTVGQADSDAVLRLTPTGQPRVMWISQETASGYGYMHYAQCDGDCTNLANWDQAQIGYRAGGLGLWGRWFALDGQGRPRFIYTDYDYDGSHVGTYYSWCDSNCADIAGWEGHDLKLSDAQSLYNLSLAITSDGGPRAMFKAEDTQAKDRLWYLHCDQDCITDAGNWTWDTADDLLAHSGYGYSFALDGQDRPRLAYYSGFVGTDDPTNNLLYYLYCDDSTCSSGWQGYDLNLPPDYGGRVSLTLDAQDQPHLAYVVDSGADSVYGIGHSECTSGCETGQPAWESTLMATSEDLSAVLSPLLESGCTSQFWSFTLSAQGNTAIGVDAQGNPLIAFNAYDYQANLTNPGACSGSQGGLMAGWYTTTTGSGGNGGGDNGGQYRIYAPVVLRH